MTSRRTNSSKKEEEEEQRGVVPASKKTPGSGSNKQLKLRLASSRDRSQKGSSIPKRSE